MAGVVSTTVSSVSEQFCTIDATMTELGVTRLLSITIVSGFPAESEPEPEPEPEPEDEAR